MTKEELLATIDLLADDEVQDSLFNLYDKYKGIILGDVYKTQTFRDRTGKAITYEHHISPMEMAESIKDALWAIVENM